jgi:hypothetical protein
MWVTSGDLYSATQQRITVYAQQPTAGLRESKVKCQRFDQATGRPQVSSALKTCVRGEFRLEKCCMLFTEIAKYSNRNIGGKY